MARKIGLRIKLDTYKGFPENFNLSEKQKKEIFSLLKKNAKEIQEKGPHNINEFIENAVEDIEKLCKYYLKSKEIQPKQRKRQLAEEKRHDDEKTLPKSEGEENDDISRVRPRSHKELKEDLKRLVNKIKSLNESLSDTSLAAYVASLLEIGEFLDKKTYDHEETAPIKDSKQNLPDSECEEIVDIFNGITEEDFYQISYHEAERLKNSQLGILKAYLSLVQHTIEKNLHGIPVKPGKQPDFAIRDFIRRLAWTFWRTTGKIPGYSADRRGPFHKLFEILGIYPSKDVIKSAIGDLKTKLKKYPHPFKAKSS